MSTHGSSSEDDGDDGDDEDSSSDEEVESMVAEYVKKIFKYVKKVNMYGYNVHLRKGRHHQHIKFTNIEHKPKKIEHILPNLIDSLSYHVLLWILLYV
jgi:N-acetylmuramoyl-L-alanine amidase CwlA